MREAPLPLDACALALAWAVAAFGAYGWLHSAGVWTGELSAQSPGFVLVAALALIVQLSGNYACAAMRRATAHGHEPARKLAGRLAVAGCAFAAISTHHALEVTGLVAPLFPLSLESVATSAPWLALSVGLAAFEPGLFWLHETLRGLAAEQERHRERHPEGRPMHPVAGAVIAATAGATLAAAGSAAAATTEPVATTTVAPGPATLPNRPPISSAPSYPDALAHARALRAADPTMSQTAIAKQVGRSRQWVGKYVDGALQAAERRREA